MEKFKRNISSSMEEPKMGLEEYKGVYIYAQQVDNKLSDIAFELVGKAKELAAT